MFTRGISEPCPARTLNIAVRFFFSFFKKKKKKNDALMADDMSVVRCVASNLLLPLNADRVAAGVVD